MLWKKKQRIDDFWFQIFSLKTPPDFRYPFITKVVKAALSLTHGSAAVERGFSESGNILTDDRANLSEKTLNAILSVRNGLKYDVMEAYKVPITGELMNLARKAHREYQLYKEEEKKGRRTRTTR